MGVAVGGKHFNDAVADIEDRHVERAAAEVVDHDLLLVFFIDAVGHSSGRRLVDDTLDLEAGDLAGILGCLTLRVVEVRRNGDDRFGDGLTEVSLGVGLQLAQDHCGDLLRRVLLAVDLDFIIGAHVTLDGRHSAIGVGDGLTLCDLTDHTLAGLREGHDGRSCAIALCVGDHDGLAALHNCDAGICSTKINTNDFSHDEFPPI